MSDNYGKLDECDKTDGAYAPESSIYACGCRVCEARRLRKREGATDPVFDQFKAGDTITFLPGDQVKWVDDE